MPLVDKDQTAALLGRVSRANVERDVRHLSTTYPTRHTLGAHHNACADWLAARFRAAGWRDVRFHTYARGNKTLKNVVAAKPTASQASSKPIKTTLVCAHFDSRMEDLGDAEARAPGANDNASGVAVLLEMARLLANVPITDNLRFVLFSGEEQGLWGSEAYAADPKNHANLRFVLNLDQIGYPPKDRAVFVDRDESGRPDNNAASAHLVARVRELARTRVNVPTRVDPAYGSDYIPFEARGVPIVGLYEAGKNYPHYHRPTDTVDKVDFAYVGDMARLALATVLVLARNP